MQSKPSTDEVGAFLEQRFMQSKVSTDEVGEINIAGVKFVSWWEDQDNAGTQDRLMLRFCSDGMYRT